MYNDSIIIHVLWRVSMARSLGKPTHLLCDRLLSPYTDTRRFLLRSAFKAPMRHTRQ